MNTKKSSQYTEQMHLTDYLNIIRRRKWVVIAFSMVVISSVVYLSFRTTPVYKATAQVILDRQSPSIMDEMTSIMGMDTSKENLTTQYQILKSRSLASKVIEETQLREYYTNRPQKKPNILTRVVNFAVNIVSPSSSDSFKTQSTISEEQSRSEHAPKDQDQNSVVILVKSRNFVTSRYPLSQY